ncbi:hypothetical protein [Mucilaginibacter jinjuensis]|uniref:PH (Pleckstrin Homology) domain-containing protein n=1 Tax=Mucilaginibacter jinjuensis TaxID=1176721 RepID=A0ABY7TB60_9SPHI|nr:hypothetical protein [Mucilaginibacter jinjuensis]WCT13315.1 hypothetical protein PQO05_05135 [Mucilaginibacter jinjuensis]
MTLLSFQHSIKYIYLQLTPYAALTIAGGYLAYGLNFLWFMAYLILSAVLVWRMIALTSVQYYFAHDMLIVSRGIIFKKVECRALWLLKVMEVPHNRLLGFFHISPIQFRLERRPADRIAIVGVDNRTMVKIFQHLNEAIEINVAIWRNHFHTASV